MGPKRDRNQHVEDPSDTTNFGSPYERPNYKKLPECILESCNEVLHKITGGPICKRPTTHAHVLGTCRHLPDYDQQFIKLF